MKMSVYFLQGLFLFVFAFLLKTEAQNTSSPEGLLSSIVQINSQSGCEGELGLYLSEYCESKGLFVERFSELKDSYNFAASLYPLDSGKPNIVFEGHIDVVPADDTTGWKYAPFSGEIAEGKVWGRGTLDDKCAAVMYIKVLERWIERAKTEDLPYNVTYLAVSGEELGGVKGAKFVCDNFIKVLNPIVVFGEGGNGVIGVLPSKPEKPVFAVAVAEKTPLWIQLDLNMDTFGHSSSGGSNALTVMIDNLSKLAKGPNKIIMTPLNRSIFNALGKAEGGITGYAIRHFRTFMGIKKVKEYFGKNGVFYPFLHNTMSINTLISESEAPNVAPHSAKAIIDFRLLPETDPDQFIRTLKSKLHDSIKVSLISDPIAGLPTECDEFYDRFADAITVIYPDGVVIPYLAAVSSDNNYFRQKNIPTYGILPFVLSEVQLASIHNKNENIDVSELRKSVEVLDVFLKDVMFVPVDLKSEKAKYNKK